MGFRDTLPASLAMILQDGLLTGIFEDALVPANLYEAIADVRPWGGGIGTQATMTRSGLIPVDTSTTPTTGSDATVGNYGFEQYTVKQDQHGKSIDTNLLGSAFATASKFMEDQKKLGEHAARYGNYMARNALYGVYGTGATWATASSSASTTLVVADATGFAQAPLLTAVGGSAGEGTQGIAVPQLKPVSGSNPLTVKVNNVANTVTGVTITAGHTADTLTLGSAVTASAGWDVVSSIGAVSYRPNGRVTANDLLTTDIATLSLFQSAVTRLRNASVPRINGAYTAHIAPATVEELFQDNNFLLAYRGAHDSAAYRNFSVGDSMGDDGEFMGRFSGIDWIMNSVTPGVDSALTNIAGVPYFRPILLGGGSLIKVPFDEMGSLLSEVNAGSNVSIEKIGGVVRILRGPLDRYAQVVSSTWSWIGGWTSGTDMLTGDAAAYKRAVVMEHA